MFSALIGHKHEFVYLLLENGVSLKDFLHDENILCELYNKLPNCSFLRKLAKRVQSDSRGKGQGFGFRTRALSRPATGISMAHVSQEVRHLLGSFTQPLYPPLATRYHISMSLEDTSVSVSDKEH